MYIPVWPQFDHLLMATSSRMMHRVTKRRSSQTGSTLQSVRGTSMASSHQIWDAVEDSQRECAALT